MSNIGKRTLLFAPYANWTLHFETDLELAQRALDESDDLTIVYCDGELPACEPNPMHKSVMCRMCKARRDRGFQWLGHDNVTYLSLSDIGKVDTASIRHTIDTCRSIEDVKKFEINGSDIGLSAVSSTVSYFREPKLHWETHGAVLRGFFATALTVHQRFYYFLEKERFDRIILFNGRYSTFRPLVRLAQKHRVELLVHERGYTFGKFNISYGTYPHSIEFVENEIFRYAHNSEPDRVKRQVGREWFEERKKGKMQNWKPFTKEQQKGLLPEKLQSTTFNVAIFNSSEDEFVAIEEWKNPYYPDQNSGIRKILESFHEHKKVHFFLRVHPNLKKIENSQTRELKAIDKQYENLTIIPPHSPVNTYDLIEASDLVITFGSLVGIEAAYAEKPTIVMGKAPYLILGSCIMPISHQAMVQIVLDFMRHGILPATQNNAYLYGYYMKRAGIPYKYVIQTDISSALLKKNGKRVDLSKTPGVYLSWIERGVLKLWKVIRGRAD